MSLAADPAARLARARASLDGLSVGDALGERLMTSPEALARRMAPGGPWKWTDDTAMALSIVDALAARGDIDPDDLAARFAARYHAEPWRGYGGGAHAVLTAIFEGAPWPLAAQTAFGGAGSYGNGGAMRVAPLGAYFADDLPAALAAAARSAAPTHAHPEGVAGAIAIAAAAATAAAIGAGERPRDGAALLAEVIAATPDGETRRRLERAARHPFSTDPLEVAAELGNGAYVSAQDTVPFCVWSAARGLDDYAAAIWDTARAHGDVDTTCAIVGGIVALTAPVPAAWHADREPLPKGI